LHGEILEMFKEERLTVGEDSIFQPDVWITSGSEGQVVIGSGCFLNIGVMVAAMDRVQIGDHCMFANGCVITDSDHRFDDRELPVTWQGFTSKGPTIIGDNVWCGANVVITSGVTVGRRSVIGAGSVVTSDVPEYSVVAGIPAKVVKSLEP